MHDARRTTISDCLVHQLNIRHTKNGSITVIGNEKHIPFSVNRIYYLYGVPGGESRGGHAHKELYQLLTAVSGSFQVTVDDGSTRKQFIIDKPDKGLMIVPGIWRVLDFFSPGAVCLVLASRIYEECDYIRSYSDFVAMKQSGADK